MKKFFRHISAILAILMILMYLIGCTSIIEEERDSKYTHKSLETMEEPLVVFYDQSAYYLLESFKVSHPEIEIKQVYCDFDEIEKDFGTIDFETLITKNGIPDMIIGDPDLSVYLADWFKNGYLADLGVFCANDVSLNQDDYFPETFEVFKDDDYIYALPLGISVDCIIATDSKYLNSSFTNLKEGYTGRELMNVMIEEIKKKKEKGEYFCEESISPFQFMYLLDAIKQTAGEVEIEEELFKLSYEIAYLSSKETDEAKNYWHGQGKYYSSDYDYAWPSVFEPRRYEGKFSVGIWNQGDASVLALSYAETANQYYLDDGVQAIYFPTAEKGNEYQAEVEIFGGICEESNRKELAYELLRELMDEKISSFGTLCGLIPLGLTQPTVNVYPINIANAISILDRFENQSNVLVFGQTSAVDYAALLERRDISKEEKVKYQNMLRGITGLYYMNKELDKINEIFLDYYDAGIPDYKSCYLETKQALNDYMKD